MAAMKRIVGIVMDWLWPLVYAGTLVACFALVPMLGWVQFWWPVGMAAESLIFEWIGSRLQPNQFMDRRAIFVRPFSSILCLFRGGHSYVQRRTFSFIGEKQLWCIRCHNTTYVPLIEEA